MKRTFQTALLLMHFSLFMMLMGGATMETFINFPNWVADIPASLIRVREFLAVRNPGMFFQTVAPLTLLTGLLFVLVGWRVAPARNFIAASIVLLITVELITFNLIYPKLRILLARGDQAGVEHSTEQLTQAAHELLTINSWRLAFMFVAAGLSAAGLIKFFNDRRGPER
jgi:hypothetical protein